MKSRILFSALLCFFFAEMSFGQISYGARLSGSMTNITDVHSYSKSRGGFQLGAQAMIPITDNGILYFQPEINYSAQGEYDQPHGPGGVSQRQKVFLSYINVPLHAKVYFTDADSEFFAEGGPYLGFKIGDKTDSLDYPTEADDNEYSNFDFGFTLGIGYSLNREVEFSLRYSYGFVDQVKNDWKNTGNSNSILNLGVSYFFIK